MRCGFSESKMTVFNRANGESVTLFNLDRDRLERLTRTYGQEMFAQEVQGRRYRAMNLRFSTIRANRCHPVLSEI